MRSEMFSRLLPSSSMRRCLSVSACPYCIVDCKFILTCLLIYLLTHLLTCVLLTFFLSVHLSRVAPHIEKDHPLPFGMLLSSSYKYFVVQAWQSSPLFLSETQCLWQSRNPPAKRLLWSNWKTERQLQAKELWRGQPTSSCLGNGAGSVLVAMVIVNKIAHRLEAEMRHRLLVVGMNYVTK